MLVYSDYRSVFVRRRRPRKTMQLVSGYRLLSENPGLLEVKASALPYYYSFIKTFYSFFKSPAAPFSSVCVTSTALCHQSPNSTLLCFYLLLPAFTSCLFPHIPDHPDLCDPAPWLFNDFWLLFMPSLSCAVNTSPITRCISCTFQPGVPLLCSKKTLHLLLTFTEHIPYVLLFVHSSFLRDFSAFSPFPLFIYSSVRVNLDSVFTTPLNCCFWRYQ